MYLLSMCRLLLRKIIFVCAIDSYNCGVGVPRTTLARLALNTPRSACLCLLTVGTIGFWHHVWRGYSWSIGSSDFLMLLFPMQRLQFPQTTEFSLSLLCFFHCFLEKQNNNKSRKSSSFFRFVLGFCFVVGFFFLCVCVYIMWVPGALGR